MRVPCGSPFPVWRSRGLATRSAARRRAPAIPPVGRPIPVRAVTGSEGGVVPAMAEIEAICGIADPVVRNLRITQAYAEMSSALAARVGPSANWCTFATWASKQAGQTIRTEDLARTVEGHLGRSDALTHVIERLTAYVRAIDRAGAGERRGRPGKPEGVRGDRS